MVCQRIEVYKGFICRQQFCVISAVKLQIWYTSFHFFLLYATKTLCARKHRHALLELFSLLPSSKKLITKFVRCFSEDSLSADSIKKAWERETVGFSDQLWKTALSCIHSCSINSRHRLIQFKVIYRFHYTKDKLHRFYPSVSLKCDQCKVSDVTMLHLFWDCPLIY